ncbi:hypothetical protein MIND_00638800 [Mycena indigotica]|uniref:Uncharacterized protein n=1 Tax=Mycena indigotica TaxID=2126181 RepID=A0A8H6SRV0_9AGAR|nr:uncharacterized protein MIND_00638800 [Mycena indigotica]KAF7304073.1 hypothetical protein MIND_00638800 [Mycena indigotica]
MHNFKLLVLLPSAVFLAAQAQSINNGSAEGSGTIEGLTWQAAGHVLPWPGVLSKGCTQGTIVDCYSMFFSFDPTVNLDPGFPSSPRQRDEFHFPTLALGASFSYAWKQYLYASTGTSTHFFHLMQLFDDTAGSPVITLDAVNDMVSIHDYVRGDGESSCGSAACPTTAIANYHGTTVTHTISGKTGASGKVSYKVTRDDNGLQVINYSATGAMGTGKGYVKFGAYRAAFSGMTTMNAVVGDWTST